MSELLLRSASWRAVTPASAGWRYLSFRVETLARGEERRRDSGDEELALVPLVGSCTVVSDEGEWEVGGRAHVFAPCTRGGPCPALDDPRDWCHEDRAFRPPRRLAALMQRTGLRVEVRDRPLNTLKELSWTLQGNEKQIFDKALYDGDDAVTEIRLTPRDEKTIRVTAVDDNAVKERTSFRR